MILKGQEKWKKFKFKTVINQMKNKQLSTFEGLESNLASV